MKKQKPLTGKQFREAIKNHTQVRYVSHHYDANIPEKDYLCFLEPAIIKGYYYVGDIDVCVDDFADDAFVSVGFDSGIWGVFSADQGTAKDQFRERLAKFIHEDIWAHWMKYLLEEKAQYMSEDACFAYGQYLIQREDAERWDRRMKTTYEDLPEKEKESDRNLADKLMKLLEEE
jgi:hypothetical protein